MNLVKTNKIKTLILNKEYSLSGNSQYIIFNKEADTDIELKSLSSIRILSNLEPIKTIIDFYPSLNILNTSGSLDYKTLLGNKKSKEYGIYLKNKIKQSLGLLTSYHTEIFPIRKKCYQNLIQVKLEDEDLAVPVYNHEGVTGRTSITKGFNFLTMLKNKNQQLTIESNN